jgi:hypothetical protein
VDDWSQVLSAWGTLGAAAAAAISTLLSYKQVKMAAAAPKLRITFHELPGRYVPGNEHVREIGIRPAIPEDMEFAARIIVARIHNDGPGLGRGIRMWIEGEGELLPIPVGAYANVHPDGGHLDVEVVRMCGTEEVIFASSGDRPYYADIELIDLVVCVTSENGKMARARAGVRRLPTIREDGSPIAPPPTILDTDPDGPIRLPSFAADPGSRLTPPSAPV